MLKILNLCILSIVFICKKPLACLITWHKENATVWLPAQVISGDVSDSSIVSLRIHHDQNSFTVPVQNNHFTFNCLMHDAVNKIWADIQNDTIACFDTLILTLGYKLLPVIKPFATVKGNHAFLHALLLNNPRLKPVKYLWRAGTHNPSPVVIHEATYPVANVTIPLTKGEYIFTVTAMSADDTAYFETIVTRNDNGITAFNIETDHAAWINKAIIYEITPHIFTDGANYNSITAKLPELKSLGINTIWLQPVYKTKHGGQGYDVTDYFSLRPEFGSDDELQHLISTAKDLNMHVLFDFVPNHTSVSHPYAQDCLARGTASPYYNFYQHTNDGSRYSSHLKANAPFMVYFWNDLVNLEFKNPEVQQWILEACKFWIKKYDIDGYRFDAMWAINARAPLFGKKLRQELKSIKPGLLLLAEDKGSMPDTYQKGFDAAYDWTSDTSWISQWSWQTDYDEKNSLTIFNTADVNKRYGLLKKALFNNGDQANLKLRFIENNDLSRFIKSHDLRRTKMAAALVFTLPGIPMIYNGQEIGSPNHPYTRKAIFKRDSSIQSQDKYELFNYYRQLTNIRLKYRSLYSGGLQEIPVTGTEAVVAFRRWKNKENIVVIINMSNQRARAELDFGNVSKTNHLPLFFKDVLENKNIRVEQNSKGVIKFNIDSYTTKILLQQ